MRIKIRVESFDKMNTGKIRTIMQNSFDVSDDLQYDYNSVVRGLRGAFPNHDTIISFIITN